MRLARLEGEPQRLARPEQVRLPHHLVERARPQRVGKGSLGLCSPEQVAHAWLIRR